MTANSRVLELSPADQVRAKLDDPRVAASLNDLLDHADLLAILISGLDGLVRRSDVISENLTAAIGELKGDANGASLSRSIPGIESLKSVDLAGLADSFATLSGKVIEATPTLNSLLGSSLTDPQAAEVLSQLAAAVVEAKTATARSPQQPRGIFGILKTAKDPDVARGLGFMLGVAKAFGRQLDNR